MPYALHEHNSRWEPMRQGQQNRRGRGRGGSNSQNSNRKPQNPLSRNFESNGPDVKIRGTASQIAEKYSTLARDASSSGDVIMAENYFQHAEHYNRIIMAAQAQAVQPTVPNGGDVGHSLNGVHRHNREMNGAMRDQPQPHIDPQPTIDERQTMRAERTNQPSDDQGDFEDPPKAEEVVAKETSNDNDKDEVAADADASRRRGGRRRYPGGNAMARTGAASSGSEKKDKATTASSDEQPSDEIVVQ